MHSWRQGWQTRHRGPPHRRNATSQPQPVANLLLPLNGELGRRNSTESTFPHPKSLKLLFKRKKKKLKMLLWQPEKSAWLKKQLRLSRAFVVRWICPDVGRVGGKKLNIISTTRFYCVHAYTVISF